MSIRRYQLTINRIEDNPAYEPDAARRSYHMPGDMQPPELSVRQVEASITEEEFDIIKQALLKVWK